MRIILANPRGFCAGVNMAIDSLERALELYGTPLFVYHADIDHGRIAAIGQHRGFIRRYNDFISRPRCFRFAA